MNRLPMNVIQFAGQNTKTYEQMKDYFFHFMSETQKKTLGVYDTTVSLQEKEAKMNEQLFAEIRRISGQAMDDTLSIQAWAQNPLVKWATAQTVDMMIESVLPETIINSIGLYTDMVTVGYGETATFEVKPNDLFTVSAGANAQRTTFRQKQFNKSITLVPVNHDITVYASLYRVLCGKESLAEFVRKAIISIETQMTKEAYGALQALIAGASFPAQLKQTGFTMDKLINLCQIVTAYNGGSKAVIVGTTRALTHVLPDSAAGYRLTTPADGANIQLIKNVYDYDLLVLPQVATGVNYGMALDDNRIYIMSPSTDKIVKGVMEGATTTNSNDYYENADLTSNATFNKRYAFEAITDATIAVIDIQ